MLRLLALPLLSLLLSFTVAQTAPAQTSEDLSNEEILKILRENPKEVLTCVETESGGLQWRDDGPATVSAFVQDRYRVAVLSDRHRDVESTRTGATFSLQCERPWPTEKPGLLQCRDVGTTWMFEGAQFTRAYLYGANVGGDPNIWVAYGSCAKR